ncbi:MAG: phosphoribosylanthranilate isomerase [Candidatus Methanosuratincola sp.]|jgi:phosphoribosylanthranilate isomerase|nr:phosphoribosylanthranilate isomerase [Candidatus Methanosuratincola sp.]
MRVKVCGMMTESDVAACAGAGADALGFVVEYPRQVPWNIGRERARLLSRMVPPYVSAVLVTSGTDPGRVLELAECMKPGVVQLHGDETEAEVREAVDLLAGGLGLKVVKALRVDASRNLELERERRGLVERALAFQECGVDGLLLDSMTERMPAGTGVPISWGAAREVREAISIPMILAGGLTPSNVSEAIRTVEPYGVDVITGVEGGERGRKDPEKVRRFVEACRRAF